MGIQGLLPLLKPITKTVHIRELQGCRIAVDAYVWLHRGAYACAADLCQGKETTRYLNYCIERARSLLEHGVSLYIVFDGDRLRAKKATEDERRAKRAQNRQEALRCLASGNEREAFQYWSKAVDVTPAMAHEWIKTIRGVPNMQYVVAPYEADAQLAFLSQNGFVDAIITEDSDALVFGCSRVLFKLEADGTAQQVIHQDLFQVRLDNGLDLRGWTEEMFQVLCILGGNCDYIASLPGLGLKTAYRYVQRHKTLSKSIKAIRFEAKIKVPHEYEERCHEALYTFHHQRVFDPASRTIRHLLPLGPELADKTPEEMAYLGEPIEDEVAGLIADGELDPCSRQTFAQAAAAARKSITTGRAHNPPPPPKQRGIQSFMRPASAPSSSSSASFTFSSSTPAAAASLSPPIQAPRPLVRHSFGLRRSSLPGVKSITAYLCKKTTVTDSVRQEPRQEEMVTDLSPLKGQARQDEPMEMKHKQPQPEQSTGAGSRRNPLTSGMRCLPAVSRFFHRSQPSEPAATTEKENCPATTAPPQQPPATGVRRSFMSLAHRQSMEAPPTPAMTEEDDDDPASSCQGEESPMGMDTYDDSLLPPCTPATVSPTFRSLHGRPSTSLTPSSSDQAAADSFSAFAYGAAFSLDTEDPLVGPSTNMDPPSHIKLPSFSSSSVKRGRSQPPSSTKRPRTSSARKSVEKRSFPFESFVFSPPGSSNAR